MPTLTATPVGWTASVPDGGGGTGGGDTFHTAAPTTDDWRPVQIPSTGVGSQVGPNGQYAVHPLTITQVQANPRHGDLTLTSANARDWIGVEFFGKITNSIGAGGNLHRFFSCIFHGSQTAAGVCFDSTGATASYCEVYDSWIDPTHLGSGSTGIIGHHFIFERCESWHSVDGTGIYNVHAKDAFAYVRHNLIHLAAAILNDPGQKKGVAQTAPGPCHGDGCQAQGNDNWGIIGNTMLAFVDETVADGPTWNAGTATTSKTGGREFGPQGQNNSCVQTNQNSGFGITTGAVIDYNFMDGGMISLNGAASGANTKMTLDSVSYNRFGRNQGQGNPIDGQASGGDTTRTIEYNASLITIKRLVGNVYDDNNHPVTIRTS